MPIEIDYLLNDYNLSMSILQCTYSNWFFASDKKVHFLKRRIKVNIIANLIIKSEKKFVRISPPKKCIKVCNHKVKSSKCIDPPIL